MSAEQYKRFQQFQTELADFVDKIHPIETVDGNELFQRLSDAAFEFYEKKGSG